jgi:hypothetical protein
MKYVRMAKNRFEMPAANNLSYINYALIHTFKKFQL